MINVSGKSGRYQKIVPEVINVLNIVLIMLIKREEEIK